MNSSSTFKLVKENRGWLVVFVIGGERGGFKKMNKVGREQHGGGQVKPVVACITHLI
jgi:hypothetical protein